ncbi:MAG: alpha/beta hydrolase [Edaphobacter sp.]|uniref:alpha/beta hydrolase n=1 Tax=Edaphobacter sp. TaxID=1934404 RepID=UPI0023A51E3E|nr:alpha/beta hydrolase [Edaphobacter sp.]MDE1175884.1 alpha/beta hydrolase [Edaphobacter sp.]
MHVVTNQSVGRSARPLRQQLAHLFLFAIASLLTLGILLWAADRVSPWPGALVARIFLVRSARGSYHRLENRIPTNLYDQRDQHYDASDPDAYLDVYSTARYDGAPHPAPTLIWLHGGGWISGDKNDIANYARIVASHGMTVVTVNYPLAPANLYPAPLLGLNTALNYMLANADRLHIDASHIFLAGNSSGAQIAAQMANIVTSVHEADALRIRPALHADQLKGVLLFGGVYDFNALDLHGIHGYFVRNALRSYTGNRNFAKTPLFARASVLHHLTPSYPPTFIVAGDADPLASQSADLARELTRQGVLADTLFYPSGNHLHHDFQFNLFTPSGDETLTRTLRFIDNH